MTTEEKVYTHAVGVCSNCKTVVRTKIFRQRVTWDCRDCGIGQVPMRQVRGTYSEGRVCDPRCWNARGPQCKCNCGGGNHATGVDPNSPTMVTLRVWKAWKYYELRTVLMRGSDGFSYKLKSNESIPVKYSEEGSKHPMGEFEVIGDDPDRPSGKLVRLKETS